MDTRGFQWEVLDFGLLWERPTLDKGHWGADKVYLAADVSHNAALMNILDYLEDNASEQWKLKPLLDYVRQNGMLTEKVDSWGSTLTWLQENIEDTEHDLEPQYYVALRVSWSLPPVKHIEFKLFSAH